ncbi:charged multivesicular body protein 2a isoform X3 [Melospiza melodia melodia]|uniref:charged multivesicular body protein 2a isoform X3 n=1 Tax=Melospiza melodia melodia TaxID=1914991 RepID=UPI002FD53279
MAGAAAPLAAPVPEVAAPFPPLAAPVPEVAAPSPPLAAPVPEVAAPSPLYASLLPRLRRRRVPGSAVTSLFAEVPLRSRGPMELLFGRRRSPEELLRQNQRALARAVRELERERQKLEAQEKKIIVDIKKMAKQGQMDAVRVLAKALVRTRRCERKFTAVSPCPCVPNPAVPRVPLSPTLSPCPQRCPRVPNAVPVSPTLSPVSPTLSPCPQDAVRVLAKDLVRTRRYERKFMAVSLCPCVPVSPVSPCPKQCP